MPAEPLTDLDVRREAIFSTNHAFVWASAGTGKTHTLTLRALHLLLNLGCPELYESKGRSKRQGGARRVIRSLVLTTFTRKAAAEMHERLYVYLDTVAQATNLESLKLSPLARKDPIFVEIVQTVLARIPVDGFHRLQAGAQALAECASELQISTIHSLAASILKRHPLEAGIHSGIRFAKEDEEDVSTLKEQLLERWWQHKAFEDPQNEEDLSRLLEWIPVSELRQWLDLACQSPWLADELERFSRPEDTERVVEWLEILIGALGSVKIGKVPQVLTEFDGVLEQVTQGQDGAWTELAQFLFRQKEYLFRRGNQTPKAVVRALAALPSEHRVHFDTYFKTYGLCLRAAIHFEHAEIWETWIRFLRRFLDWTGSAALKELGVVSFDDMINLAVRLLATNEEVRRSEYNRLRALLVDEFQDTDSAQLDLVASLLRRPQDCDQDVLGFFVGDTKQSIYRFRGVDVISVRGFFEKYETLTNSLKSKEEFHLRTNFRSSPSITRFANGFFTERLKLVEAGDLLVPFRDSTGPLPQWIQLEATRDNEDISAEEGRQLTAEATVASIQAYVQNDRAGARYRDVLILTRYNRELDSLLPVLQNAGIPVAASGAKTYYRNHEVLDLLNLLIALYHPFDSMAVAAVLRSPLTHISDDHIHRLLAVIPPGRLFHTEDSIPEFVREGPRQRIHRIRKLAASRRESSLFEWLLEVQAFIPAASYTQPHDSEGRAIVRISRLLKAFREESLNGNITPLVWLLKQRSRAVSANRWDEDCGEDVSIFDEGVDAVRAMTIHKAKGLEGSFVIVYSWTSLIEESLGARKGTQPRHLDLARADGSRLRAFSQKWGPLRIVTDSLAEATELDARYSAEEAVRLTYVAITRACDLLAMIQSPSKRLETDMCDKLYVEPEKREACFELSTWSPSESKDQNLESSFLSLDLESHKRFWDRRRIVSELSVPILRHPTDLRYVHELGEVTGESLPSTPAVGRLVHVYLEKKLQAGFDRSVLEELWRDIAAGEAGPSPVQQANVILEGFFSGELTDREGQPFSVRLTRGNILSQETPVFLTIDQQAWHGVIDLIMEEKGLIYAIDFKTGPSREPLPAVYLQQERVYGEAIRRLFPSRDTRFEFWWLGTSNQ